MNKTQTTTTIDNEFDIIELEFYKKKFYELRKEFYPKFNFKNYKEEEHKPDDEYLQIELEFYKNKFYELRKKCYPKYF